MEKEDGTGYYLHPAGALVEGHYGYGQVHPGQRDDPLGSSHGPSQYHQKMYRGGDEEIYAGAVGELEMQEVDSLYSDS